MYLNRHSYGCGVNPQIISLCVKPHRIVLLNRSVCRAICRSAVCMARSCVLSVCERQHVVASRVIQQGALPTADRRLSDIASDTQSFQFITYLLIARSSGIHYRRRDADFSHCKYLTGIQN